MTETTNSAAEIYAAQAALLKETYGDAIVVTKQVFNFRSQIVRDAEGNPVLGEDGKPVKSKRESIMLAIPRPGTASIASIINAGGAEFELLQSAMDEFQYKAAYDLLTDNPNMTAADFPIDQVLWAAIASMPAETRSRGLDKEELKAFTADYRAVMPGITGKTAEAVNNAAAAFEQRFLKYRTSTQILEKLREQLDIYISQAPNADVHSTVISWLSDKLNDLLAANPDELVVL